MKQIINLNKLSDAIRNLIRMLPAILNARFQLSIFILLIFLVACSEKKEQAGNHEHAAQTYTCPMHPQIVEKEPGSCPICGMDLVRQTAEGAEIEVTDDLSLLLEAADFTVVSDIRTVKPVREQKKVEVIFPGVISYDTRHTYSLPIRVGGRIEQLNVRYNFQRVEKGQKILEIYSPELLTAQRELLFLLESDRENERLIAAARQKLRLLGVTEGQIERLIRSRKEVHSFPVYSPHGGYIVETRESGQPGAGRNAAAGTGMTGGGGMAGGMGGAAMSAGGMGSTAGGAGGGFAGAGPAAELSVQEGMYVEPGQALFRIIDASRLWAEFNVSSDKAGLINEGDPLEISVGPGEQHKVMAQVDFISPFYSQGENFSKIRAYLQQDKLRVGQLVEGKVSSLTEPGLWIPALAVLDAGNRKLVFVKQNGVLRPVEVITGTRAGEMVEIIEGLSADDAVAHNAQFLIDSEGIVRLRNEL